MNLEKTRKIIKKRNEVVNKDKFTIIDNIDYNYGRVFEIIEKYHKPEKTNIENKNKKPFWKIW